MSVPTASAETSLRRSSRQAATLVAVVASAVLIAAYLAGALTGPRPIVIGPDSWGYLRLAIHLDTGLPIGSTGSRSFGYPVFVAAILGLRGDFADVVTVQIVLVAAMALCAALILAHFERSIGRNSPSRHTLLAIPIVVLALLSYQPTTNYAFSLLPEALCSFLGVLCLLLLLRVISGLGPMWMQASTVAAATYLLLYYLLVKPHSAAFVLAGLSLIVVVIVFRFFRRSARQGLILGLALTLAAALAASTLFLPDRELKRQFGRYSESFGPLTFFCNHPAIVLPAVRAMDLRQEFSDGVASVLTTTIDAGPNGWTVLGVNGDDCIYRSPLLAILSKEFGDNDAGSLKFLTDAAWLGIAANPGRFADKVFSQIAYAFANPLPNLSYVETANTEVYARLQKSQPQLISAFPIAADRMQGPVATPLASTLPVLDAIGKTILSAVNAGAGPLWVLVGVWTLGLFSLSAWIGRTREFLIQFALPFVVFGTYLASTAIVALAHTFDIQRYAESIAPLALIAITTTVSALISGSIAFGRRIATPHG